MKYAKTRKVDHSLLVKAKKSKNDEFYTQRKDIPSDYTGYMGVPITFLHKHNPDQFEIIKFRKGDDGKDLSINGKCPYFRIIIRRKDISQNIVQEATKSLA